MSRHHPGVQIMRSGANQIALRVKCLCVHSDGACGSKDGAVVRALASHHVARVTQRHMWVELAVGSRPCSERFFFGYSGFPLSTQKKSISKILIRFGILGPQVRQS